MGLGATTAAVGKEVRVHRTFRATDLGLQRPTGDRKVKARGCGPLPFRLNNASRRAVKATAGLGGEIVVRPKFRQKDNARTRPTHRIPTGYLLEPLPISSQASPGQQAGPSLRSSAR